MVNSKLPPKIIKKLESLRDAILQENPIEVYENMLKGNMEKHNILKLVIKAIVIENQS